MLDPIINQRLVQLNQSLSNPPVVIHKSNYVKGLCSRVIPWMLDINDVSCQRIDMEDEHTDGVTGK